MEKGALVEKAKVLAAIELKNLEIAYLNGGIPGGLETFLEVQAQLIAFLNADNITDEDILAAAGGDLSGMDGLFKKIGSGIKKAASKVVDIGKNVVTKVIPKVATTAVKIATLPIATAVKTGVGLTMTVALKALKGYSSRAFLYVFIPSDSPYLKANPKVKAKRDKALKVREFLVKSAIFDTEYFNKLIRNNIVDYYKKTPEQLIKELSEGKGFKGMGIDPVTIITALAPIVTALVYAKYGKDDVPENGDFVQPLPAEVNVTGEPLPQAIKNADSEIINFKDVQEKGAEIVPLAEQATNVAGKVAAWMGVGTGAMAIVKSIRS